MDSNSTTLLQQKVAQLPTTFGVYTFLDSRRTILYVGKAVNLRSRVRSYFASDHTDRPWVKQMIPHIADVSILLTENEVEALILESNLIKEHTPKYNSAGKDDKRYAWIIIDTREPFPRPRKTRDLGLKGKYFGPYPDGRAVNHVLRYLRKIYPYRDCNLQMYPARTPEDVKKTQICFFYHLGLCTGPCDNLITSAGYKENIDNIIKTLQGKRKSHIKILEKKMAEYSAEERFEEAATLRDKIQDLQYLSQRIDVQYGDAEEEFKEIQKSRYLAGIEEAAALLQLHIPEHELRRSRIECYDISNISGENAYGSMVVSEGPSVIPSEYRVFKIREAIKSNDPEMMRRVLTRRMKYLESVHTVRQTSSNPQTESLMKRPAIIVLDGAQAQLSAAAAVIPDTIGILGISKGKHLKRAGKAQEDEFWISDRAGSYKRVRMENPFIFQRLRDEAHRFAIKHHRKGKRFDQTRSELDEIPGIGPKRKKLLMSKFQTVNGIAKASERALTTTLKNERTAKIVFDYFHNRHRTPALISQRDSR